MNARQAMGKLLGLTMMRTVPLIGSSVEVMVVGSTFAILQGPFALHVPRSDALLLADALLAESAGSEGIRHLSLDGHPCRVDASALRSVKTLMVGAFILALPRFAADEIAGLLKVFAAEQQEVGHA